METKIQTVYRAAETLFRTDPDWPKFFREILGVKGIVRRTFEEDGELAYFMQTPEYANIQQMLTKLRERWAVIAPSEDQNRMITIRLPASVHLSLLDEAKQMKTSMNKLCISKLLQIVDQGLIPNETPAATKATRVTATSESVAPKV